MAQSERRKKAGKGKKNRKWGRSGRKPAHKRYIAERRWNRKKAANIRRMMRKHPKYKIPESASDEVKMMV